MPDRKVLKGIKPFNEYGFRSCYYHQLIAAYARYGIDERIWLMNYLPLYKFDAEKTMLSIEEIEMFSESEMEEYTGIRLIKKRTSQNLIAELIQSINRGVPVIVTGDCFYLDYREDTFKKHHIIHFILVYGYDKISKKFIVSEHSFGNSWFYVEREADFRIIKRFFENYIKRLSQKSGIALVKINKISEERRIPGPALYQNILMKEKTRISESYHAIEKFCKFLIAISADEERLKPHLQPLLDCIGIVRWKLVARKRQFEYIFQDEKLNGFADRIIENIIFINSIIAKVKFATAYNEKSMEKLRNRARECMECEKAICDFLLSGGCA